MPKFKFGNIRRGKTPQGKWLKNAIKSAKGLSSDLIMQMMPSTFETVQSMAQDAQDAREFYRDFRTNKVKYINDFKRSIGLNTMSEAWKNAKEDLKSGKINNESRGDFGGWDDDDDLYGDIDDINFGDDDWDDSDNEEVNEQTNTVINKISVSNAAPVKSAIEEQTAIMTQNVINSSKINQEIGLINQQMMQRHTSVVTDGLKSVNENVSLLVKFNSDSVSSYISASLKYYNDSMELQQKMFDFQKNLYQVKDNNNSSSSSGKRTVSDIKKDMMSAYSTFNLKDYLKVIKGNFSEMISSSSLGMLSSLGGMMGDEVKNNPIGTILGMFLDSFLPKDLKKSMTSFDDMVKNFAKGMMMKATRYGNNYSLQNDGFKGNLLFYLGKLFGVNQSYKTSVNLTKWNNGPIPFDGDTKKSIVEVIPTYLRKILSALTGQEELIFDTRNNKFTKASVLEKDYKDTLRYRTLSPYNDAISKLKSTITKNFAFESPDDRDKLFNKMKEFFVQLSKKNGLLDLKGKDTTGFIKEMDALMNEAGMSSQEQRMFKAAFNSMSKSEQTNTLVNSVIESKNNINKFFEDLEKSGTELFTASRIFQGKNGKGENLNEYLELNPNYTSKNRQGKMRLKSAFNVFNPSDKYGQTSLDYIRRIQELLVKGIRVFSYNMGEGNDTMISHLGKMSQRMKEASDRYKTDYANDSALGTGNNPNKKSKRKFANYKDLKNFNIKGITRLKTIDNLDEMSDEELQSAMVEGDDYKKKEKLGFFQWVSKKIKDKDKQRQFNTISQKITDMLRAPARMVQKALDFGTTAMYGMLFGFDEKNKLTSIMETFKLKIQGFFNSTHDWLKKHIFDPLKEKIFGKDGIISNLKSDKNKERFRKVRDFLIGKKTDSGKREGGLFADTFGEISDTFKKVGQVFTGKPFKDSSGKIVNYEGENSVFGEIKSNVISLKDAFIERYIKLKDKNAKSGLIYQLQSGVNTFKEAILGKDSEKVELDIQKGWEDVKKKLPKTMAHGIMGAAIGSMSGGGLLGTIGGLFLPGGPLGGMILGSAVGFASQSEKVKNVLFGKEDKNGERIGGMISKDFQQWFNKNKRFIAGGAAFGAIKGATIGVGLIPSFFLGGGPVGGALMGIGTSMLYRSNLMQDFLFGKPDENGNRNNTGFINKILSSVKSKNADRKAGSARTGTIGSIGVGALGGAALSAIIGKFGLLGGLLTFGGSPLIGAVLGASAGIAVSSKKWSKAIFGEVDENGIRSGGLLNKVENLFKIEIFEPLKQKILDYKFNIQKWVVKGIAFPLAKAVSPIINHIKFVGTKFIEKLNKKTSKIRNFFKSIFKTYVGDPFVRVAKWALSPIKGAIKGLLGITGKIAGGIVSMPFKALAALGDHWGKVDERKGLKEMKKKQNSDFFKGYRTLKDTIYNKYFNKELRERARIGDERYENGEESVHKQRFDARKKAWGYKAEMLRGAVTGKYKFNDAIYQALFGELGKYKYWDRGEFENTNDTLFGKMNERFAKLEEQRKQQREQYKLRQEAARTAGYDNKKDGQDVSAIYDSNSEIIKDEQGRYIIRKKVQTQAEDDVNNIKVNTDRLNENIDKLKEQGNENTDKTVNELQGIRGVIVKMASKMGVDVDGLDETPKPDETSEQFLNRTDKSYANKEDNSDSEGKAKFSMNNPEDLKGTAGELAKALDRDNKEDQKQLELNQQKSENKSKWDKARSKDVSYFKTKFKEEEKQDEEKSNKSKIIETIMEGNKENKKHHGIWSSIFGKKGLITIALLVGIPLLIKFIKDWNNNGGLAGAIRSALFGTEKYKDGEDNSGKDTGIIGTIRGAIDYKNPENVVPDNSRKTSGDVLTRFGINTLLRGTTLDKAIGRGVAKGLTNGTKTAFSEGTEAGIKYAEKSAMKSAEKSAIKTAINETVPETAEKATKSTLKKINNSSVVKFFNIAIDYVKAFFDSVIVKKLGGTKAAQIFKKIMDIFSKILGKESIIGRFIDKIKRTLQKIAGITVAAVMSGGLVNALITTTDFMAGIYEAANIFRCNAEDVNLHMRITAGVIKVFLGTNLGLVIGVIDEIYQEISGESFVTNFAILYYAALDAIFGTENADHVKKAQIKFTNEKSEWEQKNGVELSIEDYNNLQNDTVLGDTFDKINSITGGVTKKDIEDFVVWKKKLEAEGKHTFSRTESFVKYNDKYLGSEYKEYVDKAMNTNQKPMEYEDWIESKKAELKENEKLFKSYKASYKSPWDSDTIDIKKNDYYSASYDPNNQQGDAFYKQNAQQVALDSLVDPLQYNNGKYRTLTDLYNDKEVWNSIVDKKYKNIEDLSEVAIYSRYNGYGGWGRWLNKDNPEGWIELDSSGKIVGVHEPTYGTAYGQGPNISSQFNTQNNVTSTSANSMDEITSQIQNISKISGADRIEIINRYKNVNKAFKNSADDMDLMMGKLIGLIDDNGNTLPLSKASEDLMTPYKPLKEIFVNNTEIFSTALEQLSTVKNKMTKLLNKYPDAFDNMMGTALGFSGNSLSSAVNTTYSKTNGKINASTKSSSSFGTKMLNSIKSFAKSLGSLFGFGDGTEINDNIATELNDEIDNMYGMGSTYYSQKDPRWANKKYASINGKDASNDNIYTRGCGPTAMAMVATDLTGQRITPDIISDYSYRKGYSVKGGTNWNMVPNASRDLGLSSKTLDSPSSSTIENELSKGKSVIASGVGDGLTTPYTKNGHYIVLSSAKNGKVMVKDPNGIYKNGLYDLDTISRQTNKAWSIGKKYGMGPYGYTSYRIDQMNADLNARKQGITSSTVPSSSSSSNGNVSDENNIGKKVSEYARSKVGCKYSQKLRMEEGYYDCSSLCYRAYKEGAGITIPEGSTTYDYEKIPTEVSVENILPGDMILCRYENGKPEHVVLYVGNGEVVNASGSSKGVVLQKLSDTISYYPTYKIKRVLSESQTAEYNGGTSGITSSSSSNTSTSSLFSSFGTLWEKIYNKTLFGEDFSLSDLFNNNTSGTTNTTTSTGITSNATATGTSSQDTINKLQSLGATTSLVGNANAEKMWNYYKSKGYSDLQTAGLLGNIEAECEYNPKEVYQGHYGIHQWGDTRFTALQNLASSRGKTWEDLDTQLDYAYSELTGSESATMAPELWSGVTTPSQAADIIRDKFERCGDQGKDRRRYSAQLAYDTFTGKTNGMGGDDEFDINSYMDAGAIPDYSNDKYGYGLLSTVKPRNANMISDMKTKLDNASEQINANIRNMKQTGNYYGKGMCDTTQIENLLKEVITVLNTIGNNTMGTIDAINSNKNNQTNQPIMMNSQQSTTNRTSVARQKALLIASGQY